MAYLPGNEAAWAKLKEKNGVHNYLKMKY